MKFKKAKVKSSFFHLRAISRVFFFFGKQWDIAKIMYRLM